MGHMGAKYVFYWLKITAMTFSALIATRLASVIFITGKTLRISLFLIFLFALKDKITLLAGYNLDQLVVFYLIFNVFDLLGQVFYRGIYWYRNEIISGNFDFTLTKPINPLFQILVSHTDWLDIPPLILTVVFLIFKLPAVSWQALVGFIALGFVAMVLITAIHILVAAVGVLTTEVDNAIWIFRDLFLMARFPTDIYIEGIRAFLTFIVPVALIFTFPAKALLGLLPLKMFILAVVFAVIFYFLVLKFWYYSLKHYASASS